MKTRELARARISRITPPRFEHINRQIPPEPHTAMYVWHKYWSRKTWNVVGEHIKTYTKPQQVVFDPFAGSRVVAIEAARSKRRAIVCDLNPVASIIEHEEKSKRVMKIEFVEDVDLALRKNLGGRVTKRRRFKYGEVHHVEFLGEDSDLETIDIQFADGYFAINVPRFAIGVAR